MLIPPPTRSGWENLSALPGQNEWERWAHQNIQEYIAWNNGMYSPGLDQFPLI